MYKCIGTCRYDTRRSAFHIDKGYTWFSFPLLCESKIIFYRDYNDLKGDIQLSRRNTTAWNAIRSLCELDNIDDKQLYEKAKMLLGIYRKVCWSTIGRADMVAEEIYCYCGSDLDSALIYLEEFAPEKEKEQFESKIKTLFETRWMVELVDYAMIKVHDFPGHGELYHEIISKCFLTKFKYTESDLLDMLNLERSRFYDRKKEAVLVFGLSLWGNSIPQLKTFLEGMDERDSVYG